jgi:hypothetical protein
MNKIFNTVSCFILLSAACLAHSANFKRVYCNNEEFLGNPAAKRPHLHCGAGFISYKKANGDHSNITDIGNCNRTNTVFDDIKASPNAFENYPAIYKALVLFHRAGCPNQ